MAWVAGNPDSGLDPTQMEQLINTALTSVPILIPIFLVFSLLPIGLAVLGVGLHRAGVLPLWLGVLMPVGMVGVAVFLAYTVPLVLSALALLASFGTVGARLLRAPKETLSEAAPV